MKFYVRITNIMTILKLHARIIKKIKINIIQHGDHEDYENARMRNENYKNQENHKSPYEIHENLENLIIRFENHENPENLRIP